MMPQAQHLQLAQDMSPGHGLMVKSCASRFGMHAKFIGLCKLHRSSGLSGMLIE
jgi:hypothetical protein